MERRGGEFAAGYWSGEAAASRPSVRPVPAQEVISGADHRLFAPVHDLVEARQALQAERDTNTLASKGLQNDNIEFPAYHHFRHCLADRPQAIGVAIEGVLCGVRLEGWQIDCPLSLTHPPGSFSASVSGR